MKDNARLSSMCLLYTIYRIVPFQEKQTSEPTATTVNNKTPSTSSSNSFQLNNKVATETSQLFVKNVQS